MGVCSVSVTMRLQYSSASCWFGWRGRDVEGDGDRG